MIRLNLTGTVTGNVPVTRLQPRNSQKYCQLLHQFDCSPHVRIHGTSVEITGMFGPRNRVLDVDRYRIALRNGVYRVQPHSSRQNTRGTCFRDRPPNRAQFNGTVLLLLESPHKDEYLNGNPRFPIAPAQGRTGRRIDKFLACILNNPHSRGTIGDINSNSRVIIANPVQFQTSLWAVHERSLSGLHTLRNAVWKTLWDVPQIQWNFRRRLGAYRPDVVLNCCTYDLGKLVTPFLSQYSLGARIFRARHPSMWNCSVRFRPG